MNTRPGDENQIRGLRIVTDEGVLHGVADEQSEPELLCSAEEGDRPWADLTRDVLTEVFSRLPFEDRLRTAPVVCKGWNAASSEPAGWRHVNMEAWFQMRMEADYWWEFDCEALIERAVKHVVDRSCGLLEELRTKHCTDVAIDYVTDRCPSLTVLTISNSLYVTDESVINLAAGCPKLKVLDLSDCYNVSNQALEAVGRNCKSLVWLSRNMVHRNVEPNRSLVDQLSLIPGGDEEARVVGNHMVNLKHLEMMRTSISNEGLKSVVKGCPQLKSLNLACCTSLSLWAIDKVTEKCPYIVDFTKPLNARLHVDCERLQILLGY